MCGMAMTEKQGGSDVRANTTRARRPAATAGTCSPATSGSARRRCATCSSCSRRPPAGLSCFLVPRFLPDGTRNAFRIQRLKDKLGNRSNASARSSSPAPGAAGRRGGPRRADDHRDGQPHAARLRDRLGRGACARRSRRRRCTRAHRSRLRQAARRPAADAERARRPRASSPRPRPRTALRLARAYDEAASDERDLFKRLATAVAQVLDLQARARARRRGARVPRRQRLRRGVGHAARSTARRRSTRSGRARATSSRSTSCARWRASPRRSSVPRRGRLAARRRRRGSTRYVADARASSPTSRTLEAARGASSSGMALALQALAARPPRAAGRGRRVLRLAPGRRPRGWRSGRCPGASTPRHRRAPHAAPGMSI